ncbi:transposase [Mycoplasma sp. 125]|uniref:transposase n=1 Tax=Mycoplasma sp. 125 TaxID=3447505 RepID=UPI003F65C182
MDPKTGLPIFYDLYPKSVFDVSYYKKMIDKVLNLRYKSETLVLDRGYFSKDNIENIASENIDFIIMAETYNKRLSSLLNKNKDKIYKNAENLIFEHKVFAWKTYEQAFTNSTNKYFVYMFYNEQKASLEVEKYNTVLNILSKQLENIEYLNEDIYRTYGNYFDFKVDEESKIISYEINKKNYQDVLDNSGYFCLINLDLCDCYSQISYSKSKQEINLRKIYYITSLNTILFMCFWYFLLVFDILSFF